MPNDIKVFDSRQCATENFSASGAVLTWHTAGKKGDFFPLLLSNISGTFQRPVQEIYPVNAVGNAYRKLQFNGAPRGNMQCTGILSPTLANMKDFLDAVGKTCGSDIVTVEIKPFKTADCEIKFGYKITGLAMTTFGFNIQGNEVVMVNQPMAFTFTNLELINVGK